MGYDKINEALHDTYGWSPFASPAPDPVNIALEEGHSDDEIIESLHAFVHAAYKGSAFYPTYEQASYSIFVENGHYWVLNTSLALGQQTEAPVEKVADAKTVAQFKENLDHGYNRLGYVDTNCAPWTEQGQLRRDAARVPPPEWVGYEGIWELAIISGSIPVGLTGFDPAYVQKSPTLKSVRGLDAQQYLDNLWVPGTWMPTQPVKK